MPYLYQWARILFMIKYTYLPNWDSNIESLLTPTTAQAIIHDPTQQSAHDKKNSSTAKLTRILTQNDMTASNPTLIAKTTIQFILNAFNDDHSLQGLFRALDLYKGKVSPFLIANEYCIKILRFCNGGTIHLNVSPIYRYPPDYSDQHMTTHGEALDRDAIIGLLETPHDHQEKTYINHKFSLGVDAGIAFKENNQAYNRMLTLKIQLKTEGIVSTLSCEDQTTCKVFAWESLGIKQSSCNDLFEQNTRQIKEL